MLSISTFARAMYDDKRCKEGECFDVVLSEAYEYNNECATDVAFIQKTKRDKKQIFKFKALKDGYAEIIVEDLMRAGLLVKQFSIIIQNGLVIQ